MKIGRPKQAKKRHPKNSNFLKIFIREKIRVVQKNLQDSICKRNANYATWIFAYPGSQALFHCAVKLSTVAGHQILGFTTPKHLRHTNPVARLAGKLTGTRLVYGVHVGGRQPDPSAAIRLHQPHIIRVVDVAAGGVGGLVDHPPQGAVGRPLLCFSARL